MDWKYLAGFFDADGCLSIGRYKGSQTSEKAPSKGYRFNPTISWESSKRAVIEKTDDFLVAELGLPSRFTKRSKREQDHSQQYIVSLSRLTRS